MGWSCPNRNDNYDEHKHCARVVGLNFKLQELLHITVFEKWKILLHYTVKLSFQLLHTYILNKLSLCLELLKITQYQVKESTNRKCCNRSVWVEAYDIIHVCVYIYV